jgi:polyketide biosynthesis acyl carrier protein
VDCDAIFAVIVDTIREVVPELATHPIGRGDSMADLGVNSIERNEVVLLTLQAVELDLPTVQLHGPKNIGELADLLNAKLNG